MTEGKEEKKGKVRDGKERERKSSFGSVEESKVVKVLSCTVTK